MEKRDEPSLPILECDAFALADRMLEDDDSEPLRPNDFGRYHFPEDRHLGMGTMGEVWRAEEEAADRVVAIKFLRNTSEPDVWARREIKRLGKLEHASIARLYDHGVLEDGTPWLAMEFVAGQPLDRYCQGASIKECLALFRVVCEAVEYAHRRGIIHGDLKPSNILVNKDGQPKLLDFGLASQLQKTGDPSQPVATSLGFTPAYAAPEQFRGEPAGVYNDVYALGVILYELLTGTLPFDASKCTYAEVEAMKSSGRKPEKPSAAAKTNSAQVGESEWRDLDAICFKAMESDLNRRYTSVESLNQDLNRFGSYRPLQARQPHTSTYRVGKFMRRRRVAVIAAALIILGATSLVTFYTIQLAKQRNAALAEAARTQKVKQFFLDVFNHAAEDALPADKTRIVKLVLDRGTRDARSLGQDPAIQADVYQGFGTMYQEWGDLDRAEKLLRESMAIYRRHFARNDVHVVKAKIALGELLDNRGKYEEAIEVGNEVSRLPPAKSEYSQSLTLLADAHFHLGHFSIAESLNQRALAADKQLYGPNHPEIAQDLMNLGNFPLDRGDYAKAETYFRQALAMNQAWFGKDSQQAADSASYVAQALYFQGGHEAEAATLLRGALATLERAHGANDTRVAFTVATMGQVAIDLKNLDEAEADFNRAANIYREVRGDDHPSVAVELANVASIRLARKDYVRAEECYRDVIRRFAKVLPEDNLNIGIARIKLGHSLLGQKRYQDAEPELLKGYEIVSNQSEPSVTWVQTARKDLVAAYNALKEPEKAQKFQPVLDAKK